MVTNRNSYQLNKESDGSRGCTDVVRVFASYCCCPASYTVVSGVSFLLVLITFVKGFSLGYLRCSVSPSPKTNTSKLHFNLETVKKSQSEGCATATSWFPDFPPSTKTTVSKFSLNFSCRLLSLSLGRQTSESTGR